MGTPIQTLETSEDRDLFAHVLKEIDIPIAEFIAVKSVDDALAGADPFMGVEMASTGEITCFGDTLLEAYWTSIQGTMNFHVPHLGMGLLFGGDVANDCLSVVAQTVSGLGHRFYASSPAVAQYVAEDMQVIQFPQTEKRALGENIRQHEISAVFNLARARAESILDKDYVMKGNAIDFGIALFKEPNTLFFLHAVCTRR